MGTVHFEIARVRYFIGHSGLIAATRQKNYECTENAEMVFHNSNTKVKIVIDKEKINSTFNKNIIEKPEKHHNYDEKEKNSDELISLFNCQVGPQGSA